VGLHARHRDGISRRFYLATGDAEALRTAEEYAAFGRRLDPDRYARHRLTKGGWGGAVMYLATGDGQHLRAARSVAEHYVSTQHSDGYWYDRRTVTDRSVARRKSSASLTRCSRPWLRRSVEAVQR